MRTWVHGAEAEGRVYRSPVDPATGSGWVRAEQDAAAKARFEAAAMAEAAVVARANKAAEANCAFRFNVRYQDTDGSPPDPRLDVAAAELKAKREAEAAAQAQLGVAARELKARDEAQSAARKKAEAEKAAARRLSIRKADEAAAAAAAAAAEAEEAVASAAAGTHKIAQTKAVLCAAAAIVFPICLGWVLEADPGADLASTEARFLWCW